MSTFLEQYDQITQVGELHLKGYSAQQIANQLDMSVSEARKAVKDHKDMLASLIESEVDLRDKALVMLYEAEEHMRMVSRKAWELYDMAEEEGSVNQMNKALALVHKVQKDMSELLQASGVKDDAELIGQLQQAKRNQDILEKILREVTEDCDRCRMRVRRRLSELSGTDAEPVEVVAIEQGGDEE